MVQLSDAIHDVLVAPALLTVFLGVPAVLLTAAIRTWRRATSPA